MAKVFLESGETYVVGNNKTDLYGVGGAGLEVVNVAAGVSGVTVDQNVDRMVFNADTSALNFKQSGINLEVYSGTTLLASIPLQADADGTLITTATGTMQAKVSATGMTLGGAPVSATAAGMVSPTTVDTSVKAPSSGGGSTPTPPASGLPELTVANVSATEGNSGTKNLTFVLSLSSAPSSAVVVNFETVSESGTGIATSNDDYQPAAGVVSFAAGQTAATVSVVVNGDTTFEPNETFKVKFSSSGIKAGVTATGTITNDDSDTSNVAQTFTLTTGADSGTAFTGGAGGDTFNAAIGTNGTATNGTTLNAGDNLNGGTGTDTLAISISGTNTAAADVTTASVTLAGVENIAVSNFQSEDTSNNVINLATATGVSKISVSASAASGDTSFTSVRAIVAAEMGNGSGDLSITYADTAIAGTADVQTLKLDGQTAGTFTAAATSTGALETISITSSTSANTVQVTSAGTTTIIASGDQNLTLTEGMTDTITRVNASAMTGKFGFTTNDATSISVTGGSADDTITLGATFAATDSVDGGAGNDTLSVGVAITQATLANVSNVETVAVTGANNVTLTANVSPTSFTLTDAGVNALTLGTGYTNATTVSLGLGDTVTNTANVALTVNATVTNLAGATVTGGTGTDTINLTASGEAPAAITLLARTDGVETITIVDGGDTSATAGRDVSITTGAFGSNITIDASALDGGTTGAATDLTNENLTVDGSALASTRVLNVTGGGGLDTITGGAGNDIISGGAGNDSINGASGGSDSIAGGDGVDTINMGAALTSADTIDGGGGNDKLIVTSLSATGLTNVSNIETLVLGGAGSSATLTANLAFTTIDMDDGTNDTTAQSLTLGTGYTAATTVLVDAGDTVTNTANVALTVTATDAKMAGTTIAGGTGSDTLNVTATAQGAANITLASTVTGVEVINILDGGDVTTGTVTAGFDAGVTTGNYASAATVATTLTISGATLDAGTVTSAGAMNADFENLTVDGSGIANALVKLVITGGAGADSLTGGAGNDVIDGGAGNDQLTASAGNDNLSGGEGVDTFVMAGNLTAQDTISGGNGTDVLSVTSVTDGDLLNVTSVETLALGGTATLGLAATAAGIVTIDAHTTASAVNASVMTSGVTINTLISGTTVVNETLTGGSGNDTFNFGSGLAGTRTLDTLDGSDVIAGGAGVDTINISNALGSITPVLDLNTGKVTTVENINVGTASGLASTSAETVTLTINDITLTTVQTVNISAGAITDALDTFSITNNVTTATGGTSFSITGGAGNDVLNGGVNADTIVGGSGNDSITGNGGADVLTGGTGNDVFVVTTSIGTARDTITDFTTGGDKLQVAITSNATVIDATVKGTVTSTGDASSVLSSVVGEMAFNSATGSLLLDLNGNGLIQGTDVQVALQNAGAAFTTFNAADIDFTITQNGAANQKITTGSGNDTIVMSTTLTTADTINGGAGSDTLTFTDGDSATTDLDLVTNIETITLGAAATAITLVDALVASGSSISITAAAQAGDTTVINGSAESNGRLTLSVTATTGATTLIGGAGNDTLIATSSTGNITLTGGAGADTMTVTTVPTGSNGTALLTGGDGADTITGSAGVDTFVYLLQADLVSSSAVVDSVNGGTGTDILSIGTTGTTFTIASTDSFARMSLVENITAVSNTAALSITLGASAQTAGIVAVNLASGASETGNVIDVSAFTAATTLTGSATGSTAITGGSGNDVITASTDETNVDTLTGGDGDDQFLFAESADLIPTAGNDAVVDSVVGGNGTDRIVVTGAISIGAAGTDTLARVTTVEELFAATSGTGTLTHVVTLASDAALSSVRTIDLSNSTASGTTGAVTLTGVTVPVTVRGANGGGANTLVGGSGADTLVGGSGADTLTGGDGADSITGGLGIDLITGGLGADTIILTESTASADIVLITSGLTADSITGFTAGSGGDVLRFDISDLQTAGAVASGVTIKLADLDGSTQVTAANASVLTVAGATTLTNGSTALFVSGTYATSAAVIDALGTGGASTARQITTAAGAGVTANDTVPLVYSDGTNTYVGLLRFVNSVAAGTTVADSDLAFYQVATLVGVTDPSAVVGANLPFDA